MKIEKCVNNLDGYRMVLTIPFEEMPKETEENVFNLKKFNDNFCREFKRVNHELTLTIRSVTEAFNDIELIEYIKDWCEENYIQFHRMEKPTELYDFNRTNIQFNARSRMVEVPLESILGGTYKHEVVSSLNKLNLLVLAVYSVNLRIAGDDNMDIKGAIIIRFDYIEN